MALGRDCEQEQLDLLCKDRLVDYEIENLASQYAIHTDTGESLGWYRSCTSLSKLKERFFCVEWREELS